MFGGVIGEWLIGATLVNGEGEVNSYDQSDVEALSALRCCVGMCGVFYELVFKVNHIHIIVYILVCIDLTQYWYVTKI